MKLNIQNSAFKIQHLALGIQNSTFNIQHLIVLLWMVFFSEVDAQKEPVLLESLDQAIETATANNPGLKAVALQTRQEEALKGGSWNLPKTSFSLTYGQYNSIYTNDNQFNISQSMAFPTVYIHQKKLAKARIAASEGKHLETQNELVQQVKATWYALWMEKEKQRVLQEQDSLFQEFVKAATLRYQTGESNLLEKTMAVSQGAEVKVKLQQNLSNMEILQIRLQTLLNTHSPVEMKADSLQARESTALLARQSVAENPTLAWFAQQKEVAAQEKAVEKSKMLPEITVGYFNQSLNGPNQDLEGNPVVFTSRNRFTGFQAGVAIPLFAAKSNLASIRAAEFKKQESEAQQQAIRLSLEGQLRSLTQQYEKYRSSLAYYKQNALPQATLLLKQAQKGFKSGNIDYVEYLQGLTQALTVRMNYLDILNEYNQTLIQTEFILGIQ